MKKIFFTVFLCLSCFYFFSDAVAAPISSSARIKVDGISANTNVVITGHKPVFSWDFTLDSGAEQDTVDIEIGTSISNYGSIWDFSDVVMVGFKSYTGTTALTANTTYYWQIQITDDATPPTTSAWIKSTFHTVQSAIPLSSSQADLEIDRNNPFNPCKGQYTTIRYQLTDSNEDVFVRVYTINGELVKTLAEHLAQQGAVYSVDWDGKNAEGYIVASGVYLVNLKAGAAIRETRRVVVIK